MRYLTTYKPSEVLKSGFMLLHTSHSSLLLILLSLLLHSVSFAQVVVDNTSSVGPAFLGNTVTVSHTTGSDANRLMLVGISSRSRFVSSVTYDGVLLDAIVVLEPGNRMYTYIYQMINPPTGTADVVVSFTSNLSTSTAATVGVMTFSNTDQVNPLGVAADSMANNNSPIVTVASNTNQLVFGVLTQDTRILNSMGANQTERWNTVGLRPRSTGATKPGTASNTTLTYALSGSSNWTAVAIPINRYPIADLATSKVVSDPKPFIGEVINFTITVSNNGPDNASGVQVLDILPDGYTYLSDNPSLGSYDFNSGIWNVGTINNGGSESISIEVIVNGSGTYLNTATVSGSLNDPTPGNNTGSTTITICNAGGTPPLYNN